MSTSSSPRKFSSTKQRLQPYMEKLGGYPRWAVFQGVSIAAIFLCFLLALPFFFGFWKPEREKDTDIKRIKFSGPQLEESMLPKNPSNFSQRVRADVAFRNKYSLSNSTAPYASMYAFSWFSGVLDLAVTSQELVPDSQKLELSMSGHAYGPITYDGTDGDVVLLSIPSVIPEDRATKPVPSCKQSISSWNWGCADLVIAFGSQQLSYSTADGLGMRNFAVNVDASNGLDYYPFDRYIATGTIKAVVAMQMSKTYWFQALANALDMDKSTNSYNNPGVKKALNATLSEQAEKQAAYPDVDELTRPINVRVQLTPSIQGWNIAGTEVTIVNQTVTTESAWLPKFGGTGVDDSVFRDQQTAFLEYYIVYERSSFTKGFAISIVICMWILSIYLLVLAIDHVIVRRRPLEPDTVGYSVGMLFALPALRLLLDAPFGSYIDFLGFAWNMVLVAVSVFLFFTGTYMDHKHKGPFFQKNDEPTDVVIAEESQRRLLQMVATALRNEQIPVDPQAAAQTAARTWAGKARQNAGGGAGDVKLVIHGPKDQSSSGPHSE